MFTSYSIKVSLLLLILLSLNCFFGMSMNLRLLSQDDFAHPNNDPGLTQSQTSTPDTNNSTPKQEDVVKKLPEANETESEDADGSGTNVIATTAPSSSPSYSPSSYRLVNGHPVPRKRIPEREPLNQFFVFGMLIGIVCTISMCTCIFKPRSDNNHSASNNTASGEIVNRLFRVKEPFETDKPYRLNFDERGFCYASPLKDDEIPPLPTYAEACRLPPNPYLPSHHQQQQKVEGEGEESEKEDISIPPPYPAREDLSAVMVETIRF